MFQRLRKERGKKLSSLPERSLKQFAQLPDLLVVVGGDGTLNEVVNGIEEKIPLAFVPAGTANVFARELRISENVTEAINIALGGRRKKIDIGVVNQRKFLLMTGVGIDADVIDKVSQAEKELMGKAPFVAKAFLEGIKFKPPKIKVKCANREEEASFVVIANSSFYGGGLKIAPWARPDDGWLEVCLFKGRNSWEFFQFAFFVAVRQQSRLPIFDFFRATEIEISSNREVLVQCDGELVGTTPVKISLLPAHLEVAVPL